MRPLLSTKLPSPIYLGLTFLFIYLFFGTRDWTQGHSTSQLHPQPYFIFTLKQGFARLIKVSLFAESVLKPVILLCQPPKYWDCKHVPLRPALPCFLCVRVWCWGLNLGVVYLWATLPAQLYFLFWNRVSLSCWGWSQTCNSPVSASQVLGLQACTKHPASLITFNKKTFE